MKDGPLVFYHLGFPVRLAGRRANGTVLVEDLLRDDHRPRGTWRELDPDKLQHARLNGARLHELIVELPLVEFVTDQAPDDPRQARLPYADH